MEHAAGITVTTINNAKVAIIDLEKYGKELQAFFKKNGISTEPEENEDEFEKKWETGISLEEVRTSLLKHIDTLPWDK